MARKATFECVLIRPPPQRLHLNEAQRLARLLHRAIHDSFGWQSDHLWDFRLPTWQSRPIAGFPVPPGEDGYRRPVPDAKAVKLNTDFTGKSPVEWCQYAYAYGDNWLHDVKPIAVRSDKATFTRRLLAGDRAGPREDCGAPRGYDP